MAARFELGQRQRFIANDAFVGDAHELNGRSLMALIADDAAGRVTIDDFRCTGAVGGGRFRCIANAESGHLQLMLLIVVLLATDVLMAAAITIEGIRQLWPNIGITAAAAEFILSGIIGR